ncbi:geranylgeranylglyceryl/heptaprenylglyceryl phosphate synthase [Litoribacter ruber]|uniref:Geranylgeranylglyceryl phosphate synthase n=1 Tax=Litoribacter ruber TaxID=702568 RepID=A0AAP2G5B6_9BACT|nr:MULTISPECIES: geranylgeranylglyceryl/heptaprenylglyceryl phosphate synthase [Litoribacter]MBS9525365.1 geranylgeranylglyceryl/heptaprenylglyceryl phosphate synthase [Litoribacter alkaliphilus]MBT0809751.1 geranylgeranylglyceryl/heptaprenylglyceryl phosphate synthase [Litoribacter ruber]
MTQKSINHKFARLREESKKGVALLLDPDKVGDKTKLYSLIQTAVHHQVDFFFVGGSLLMRDLVEEVICGIKDITAEIPVLLFPGNAVQVSDKADGILFLSLISGRNPEFLIGQQVTAAPLIAQSNLEVLPTAYMLVNDGEITSVNYVSQTLPLPNHKPDLAVATALAGKYLGMQYVYLEAGSGANSPVNPEVIQSVKKATELPLIVGGGIRSVETAKAAWMAGADVVVLGNGVEKNPNLLIEVLEYANVYNLSLNVN